MTGPGLTRTGLRAYNASSSCARGSTSWPPPSRSFSASRHRRNFLDTQRHGEPTVVARIDHPHVVAGVVRRGRGAHAASAADVVELDSSEVGRALGEGGRQGASRLCISQLRVTLTHCAGIADLLDDSERQEAEEHPSLWPRRRHHRGRRRRRCIVPRQGSPSYVQHLVAPSRADVKPCSGCGQRQRILHQRHDLQFRPAQLATPRLLSSEERRPLAAVFHHLAVWSRL